MNERTHVIWKCTMGEHSDGRSHKISNDEKRLFSVIKPNCHNASQPNPTTFRGEAKHFNKFSNVSSKEWIWKYEIIYMCAICIIGRSAVRFTRRHRRRRLLWYSHDSFFFVLVCYRFKVTFRVDVVAYRFQILSAFQSFHLFRQALGRSNGCLRVYSWITSKMIFRD